MRMGRKWVSGARSNAIRLGACALLSIIPVVLLGVVLAGSYRTEARRRGVAEGRAEAQLVARTAIEPLIDADTLSAPVGGSEKIALTDQVGQAVLDGQVLRLRLRGLVGHVVFSYPVDAARVPVDDEAVDAAKGTVVAHLTTLNGDDDPHNGGPAVVEVYLQLRAGSQERPAGVLEVYLPYAPISADLAA